jgi:elongation factor G
MTSMHVPEPVISVAVKPADHPSEIQMSKALRRFTKEDPTFRVMVDSESGETIIQGMGELHLDVYLERMRREYAAVVVVSPPEVAYRETITRRVDFDYTHKKQTGGSGQYGKVVGYLEPNPDAEFEFVDSTKGGVIPKQFIPAVEKGFKMACHKGLKVGFPVVNVRVVVTDGNSHSVDSSEIAFTEAARGAWREVYMKAGPKVLEPLMRVVVEGPTEFSGAVMKTLMQRRGIIIGSQEDHLLAKAEAEVPLAEMFGYATALRSSTQGKAEFTMEFSRYLQLPENLAKELMEKLAEEAAGKKK